MRKRLGLVLLASLTMSSVLLVAGPSSAAAVSTPKGKVYAGIEVIDPDGSPNVAVFGEGPNPVPFVLIDYNAGNCRNDADDRLPVILTGLVKVSAADGDGMRSITNVGPIRMQCTNAEKFVELWTIDFTYNSNTDVLGENDDWATMTRTCNGQDHSDIPTVVGDSGKNTLVGTSGMEIIDGRGGSDIIRGKGGHDILCGGAGHDIIKGGAGIDLLIGNDGRNKLYGEEGMDVLLGGDNPKAKKREILDGGPSWDVLFGWEGRDYMVGRSGNDVLFGGPGSDKHFGGSGDDACYDTKSSTFKSCEKVAKRPAVPIRIVGNSSPESPEGEALQAELDAFIADKALDYTYEEHGDPSSLVGGGDAPDLIIQPQPGAIMAVADDLVDISAFFANPTYLEDNFGEYMIELVTDGAKALGGPIKADMKSLVWYQPALVTAAGYSLPTSFAELKALSEEMVDDGETPWCQYMEHGWATGWLGTDWIEDLLLSKKGPGYYDDWVAHTVPFTAAPVDKAFDRYLDMMDTAGFVHDRDNVLNLGWAENVEPLSDGDCLMHKQASFLAGMFGDGLGDFDTFKFPPVNDAYADAVLGGGVYVAATNDSEDVVEFVRFMLKPKFGEAAIAEGSGWILPNLNFDNKEYTDSLTKSWAKDVRAAINAGQYRFDASDLMPPEIGLGSDADGPGAFWQAVQDIVSGDRTVPQVLQDIEDAWPN
ncbi:MAG: extracellular solute-binding protein [bacterium]|nr:extracellular solute-binding protein [bacterium]